MIDALGPGTTLGYCTNVHAGATLDQVLSNLDRYAVPVKRAVSPKAPMGVGLWLSHATAGQLIEQERISELRHFLESRGLMAYTLNGFPFGDFHQPVVKQAVYEPDWTTQERYDYTLTLARILAELLPEGGEGSISTLPVGWPAADEAEDRRRLDAAGNRLADLVHQLARLELDTGKLIHVDLEPEPGCLLDTADDIVSFFQGHLLGGLDDDSVRGYLRVCHDVCHSAVMFEPQRRALEAYQSAGIQVGKVQLSSALSVNFDALTEDECDEAATQLRGFAEDRYLHQTSIRLPDGTQTLASDLPDVQGSMPRGCWRVHFHVPLFAQSLGRLGTTQKDAAECLSLLCGSQTRHYEVETYAWDVLPAGYAPSGLAEGIAREIRWVLQHRGSIA